MALESIRYSNGRLEILDQLLLPAQNKYVSVKGVEDGWKVINRMQVRGAPAIAIVGCLSLAVEIYPEQFEDKKSLRQEIEGKLNYLVSARPTAVNVSTIYLLSLALRSHVNSTRLKFGFYRFRLLFVVVLFPIDENRCRRADKIRE